MQSPGRAEGISHATGPFQPDQASPALSLPEQATCNSPEQAQHGGWRQCQQTVATPSQDVDMQDKAPAEGEEQEEEEEEVVEAYVLSDLWKVFVQEVSQVNHSNNVYCLITARTTNC